MTVQPTSKCGALRLIPLGESGALACSQKNFISIFTAFSTIFIDFPQKIYRSIAAIVNCYCFINVLAVIVSVVCSIVLVLSKRFKPFMRYLTIESCYIA